MTEVTIQANDSGSFMAYVAKPASLPAPGIVVIQEIFGVNDVMRRICDQLAEQGFLAICPDIFWRQEPGVQISDKTDEEWARAFELFKGFDADKGVNDLTTTMEHLKADKDCTGKAATMGFCLGGKLSYMMAARSDADCNVSYYGVAINEMLGEAGNIKHPLMMHMAERDEFVPPEAQAQIKEGLAANDNVIIHSYEGLDHAFARIDGIHYNPEAAKIANDRTFEFLKAHLGG